RFVDPFEKILRDNALERFGQGRANLVLLVRRENVDDSVNGFRGTGSVQCSENKVTSRRRCQSQLNRLEVAQLTHEQNVRVFTQRATEGCRERARMHADFTMLHQAVLTP